MIHFSVAAKVDKRPPADVVVWPYYLDSSSGKGASHGRTAWSEWEISSLQSSVEAPLSLGDFKGKEGELLFLYLDHQPEKRLLLLGLGAEEKVTAETLRRVYASLAKALQQRQIKSVNLIVPKIPLLTASVVWKGLSDGLLLAHYIFDKLKGETLDDQRKLFLEKVTLVGAPEAALAVVKRQIQIAEGVYLVRDLVNSNADEVTPTHLVKLSQKLAKSQPSIKVTVFDKARLIKEKMGLILAVGQASLHDPALIFLEYNGLSEAVGKKKNRDHTIIVGKGITYDTGGLNLKSSGMETMKADMAGSAVALATVGVAASLKLPIHLTAILATAENCISASSYKPGDVYIGYSGKTVEITNTDAEGRLVLADALAYAVKNLKPSRLIDIATLTGGVDVALGNEATGLMANNDLLADALMRAGNETFERVWRLPLFDEYKDLLKSEIADIKNAASRSASPITGAMFLKAFVGNEIPWAHLDIASTAYLNDAKRYHPKGGTGVGLRLLIEFLATL